MAHKQLHTRIHGNNVVKITASPKRALEGSASSRTREIVSGKSLPMFLCPTNDQKTLVIRAKNFAEAIEQACNYLGNGWQRHETLDW